MVTKALFIGVFCLAVLVIVAALLNVVPSTAALLVALAGLAFTAGTSYLVSFRGPEIKLVHIRDGVTNVTSGYAAGMPSTWNVVVRLIAVNDGARPGILSRFQIDALEVEHLPRPPRAFQVTFSGLERAGGSPDRAVPLSLPLLLASKARERVECRAVLSFLTADPNVLADDLREVSAFRVKFRYWSGTESRSTKERSGNLHLTYDELRRGLRSYWAGAPQFAQLVRRLDTG